MWRDRTNLFISYRQSYAHHPNKRRKFGSTNGFSSPSTSQHHVAEERRGLMSAGAYDSEAGAGDAVIEMDLLPPRWLDVQDEVTDALADVAREGKQLEQLCQKHVLPGFDDEAVKRKEEREIERLTQLVTRKFHACQKAIKQIDVMVRESSGGVNKGEEIMARNLKISLATKVGEASSHFRKKQSSYLKKLRSMDGLPSPTGGSFTPVQNPFTDPSMMESETDRSFSQNTLQQTAQKRRYLNSENDSVIAQREKEIEDIAQGIIELANIFQELQTMVIDQGSMLDRIDFNVESMATDVKEADKELKVATGYQRRSLKRKIMLLLIIVIAGMFILLGLKLSGKTKSSSSPPAAPPSVAVDDASTLQSRRWSTDIDQRFQEIRDWRRRRRRSILLGGRFAHAAIV